jgi:hypothetical protein
MNGTAVRLPDQFSPGAAAANAATPTCCCCCCCCAITSVGAAVHIPEALYQDTKELERPRSALVTPAAAYPLLVFLLPIVTVITGLTLRWGWWVSGLVLAVGWAIAAGFIARSPKPWASLRRMLGWIGLWCVEPFVVTILLGPVVVVGGWGLGLLIYACAALAFGYWIFLRYRAKR